MTPPAASLASRLVCAGCGAEVPDIITPDGAPFRCPHARAGDDIDHVVSRVLDPSSLAFPGRDGDPNPFIRYRTLLHSYHGARARGWSDGQFVTLVTSIDERVAAVDGRGFRITPFEKSDRIAAQLEFSANGAVWIKDETRNVSGSHKARHLMGIMLYLEVLEATGGPTSISSRADRQGLAIASCGNAALAAAVVAGAAGRHLDVFIPPDAPRSVIDRLQQLGATTVVCPRQAGMSGDPCYLRFQNAVVSGSVPFCCQGTANGLTIEGGETLGYEIIDAPGAAQLDAVVIQVGGGALASAVIQAYRDAQALGRCARLPRFYTVQTRGAFPLKRAYDQLVAPAAVTAARTAVKTQSAAPDAVRVRVEYARTHRHEFMWPWEEEPHSVARGILDDETYDWLAVVQGMLLTGGHPVVVSESELESAYAMSHDLTDIDVDHTGAAGLAGLIQLRRSGAVASDEQVAVIFSGARR